jgi:anaerobic magnesium-protoporphyrin IX monomethyl ester cyclase
MLAEGLEEYERKLATTAPGLVLFYEDHFNFLSKMCLANMRRAACDMIARAREAGARVIVAGPDVTDAPEAYLRAGADITLLGEGLAALRELIPRLEADIGASAETLARGVSGVAIVRAGSLLKQEDTRVLPGAHPDGASAAWDLLDIERYRSVWLRSHGYFSLNMAASRGCSFRCSWCAKPIWGNRYLQRSPHSVATEMLHLKRLFNVEHVWFADDIFGLRVDWVTQFGAALAAGGGGIPFTIQTRADLVSEPMAQSLAAAGCREAWLGAESGSQRVLDAMNKGTTVAEILTARTRLGNSGIRVGFFIQLGYLDEDLEDILGTRALLEQASPDDIGVSVSYPLPGTRFHQLVKTRMGEQTNWRDSGDLAMMFQGTYISEFYRAVRDLMHDQVRLQNRTGPGAGGGHSAARRDLERRWKELVSRERLYRSRSAPDPMASPAADIAAAAAAGGS